MSLKDIIEKISADAKAEAEALLSKGKAEAEAISNNAQERARDLRSELTKKATDRAEDHAGRIKILSGLDLRKDTLKEKKRLIEEALAGAEDKIKSLPPDEYLAFLKPIILQAVESFNEEIIPSRTHKSLFTSEFIQSLNNESPSGVGNLRLSEETGDFSGGFILRDGKKETNLTLRTLINEQRDALEPEIADILFGEGK